MKKYYIHKGSDIEAIFLSNDIEKKQKVLPITFSSWNSTGKSQFFGETYFYNYNISAVLIRSLKNHWWHTFELIDVFNYIKEIDKELLLYGTSMGGYAALLFSGFLNAACISLSPQVSIFHTSTKPDPRWRNDWDTIKQKFDESAFIKRKTNKIRLFFFRFHAQLRLTS